MVNIMHYHSGADARALGNKLVSLHQPSNIDYTARFGLTQASENPGHIERIDSGNCCASCKRPLSQAEASYCRNRPRRFAGQLLCLKCQKYAPANTAASTAPAVLDDAPSSSVHPAIERRVHTCDACGAAVDSKVVAFCRFNSKRFGKRILCRACQGSAAKPSQGLLVDRRQG
jgi:hypothetical protein